MQTTRFSAFLFPLLCCAFAAAQAVSPADRTDYEGSSYTNYPLGRASCRMQTLHSDLPAGAVLSGHSYRRDAIALRGQVDALTIEIQVTASLASTTPDAASATFANNAGTNPVVVLPRSWLQLPATTRPQLDPAPSFELIIPWVTPFVMPPNGGTLCLDVEVFGNQSPLGNNRNVSLYLDAHELFADGRSSQPGFRLAQGCAAPGSSTPCYANLDLWHFGSRLDLDVSLRAGVPDKGNGQSMAFVTLGTMLTPLAMPNAPHCVLMTSGDLTLPLPGSVDSAGSYDGTFAGIPVLPIGFRLWCQAGSLDLGTGELTLADLSGIATAPFGPTPIPAVRIVNASQVTAATGTVSSVVPVVRFF